MKLKILRVGKWPVYLQALGIFCFLLLLRLEFAELFQKSFTERLLMCYLPYAYFIGYIIRLYVITSAVYDIDQFGITIHILWVKKSYRWEDFKVRQLLYTNASGGGRYLLYHRCVRFCLKEKEKSRRLPPLFTDIYALRNVWSDIYIYFNDDIPKAMRCAFDTNEEAFLRKLEEWGVTLQTKIVY